MCQAKKDGGARCASHLKEEIARLEKTERDYYITQQMNFLQTSSEILSDPLVVKEYEDKVRKIRDEEEFNNIVTKDDVVDAHKVALEAKQLRDEKAEEARAVHSGIASSLKSFRKLFRRGNDVSDHNPQDIVLEHGNTAVVAKNPEGAVKAFYFQKEAIEEYRQVTVRQRENPTPEGLAELRQVAAIRVKAEAEVQKYGINSLMNGSNPDGEKVLDDSNPRVSVYQYNYEYEVEQYNNKKNNYENASEEEKVKREKYQSRADKVRQNAALSAGPFTKAARKFENHIYPSNPKTIELNRRIAEAKDDYRLSPSYRKILADKIVELNNNGMYKESEHTQMKLDVLTEMYNYRQARRKSVDEHMKVNA